MRGRSARAYTVALRMVAMATAVVLVISACGTDEPAVDQTTPSGSSSSSSPAADGTSDASSPTSDIDAPTPAPEILVDDTAGAAAAAEYFFALVHFARATGQTQRLAEISSPTCIACGSFLDDATRLHEAGGWVESSPYVLRNTLVGLPSADDRAYGVVLELLEPAGVRHNGDGSETSIVETTYPEVVLRVEWVNDGFIIDEVDLNTS